MKFARLVDIDDDNQILAYIAKDENDNWRLKITSIFERDEVTAEPSFWVGSTGIEAAEKAFAVTTDDLLRKLFEQARKTSEDIFARMDAIGEEEIPG